MFFYFNIIFLHTIPNTPDSESSELSDYSPSHQNTRSPRATSLHGGSRSKKDGGDLLSRLAGSTIGAGGLNFSVRNGKRWNPAAIAA